MKHNQLNFTHEMPAIIAAFHGPRGNWGICIHLLVKLKCEHDLRASAAPHGGINTRHGQFRGHKWKKALWRTLFAH
jgi:hypothetical protein